MVKSMTGFAAGRGAFGPHSWAWELRSVNGKGLDLRIRVPDWIVGLETGLRKRLDGAMARGNVTLNLRVAREDAGASLSLNTAQVETLLAALVQVEEIAMAKGISLSPSRAADILNQRGVLEILQEPDETAPICAAILADFETVLGAFLQMRADEGAALDALLANQLNQIETLTAEAEDLADARRAQMTDALNQSLARVMDGAPGADPQRVAQELAMLAVKADVTEEIDRLGAHIAAARALLAEPGAVGRKLDFLTQEFNREANTLCAKSQHAALTRVGLDLKAVIDQFREQAANVE